MAFLENDRERLYSLGQDLFQDLKEKYDITHFYFHDKNGVNFVRLHNEEKYGDVINRTTFKKSERSMGPGIGIDLGKTAFALRFVQPYYDGDDLIGYVEFGKEIDEFLKELKSETNNEFSIVVKKEALDKEDWESVVELKGVEDSWDELGEYVLIDSTVKSRNEEKDSVYHEKIGALCLTDENIKRAGDSLLAFNVTDHYGRYFSCVGFPLTNVDGEAIGVVFSFEDETDLFGSIRDSSRILLIGFLVIFLASFTVFIFLFLVFITYPLSKIKNAAVEISNGNMDVEIDISGKDEIAEISKAISKMRDSLKVVFDEYEKNK